MPAPSEPPLGLHLARVAKTVATEFDAALTAAGGSMSTWLVLLALKTHAVQSQRELATAIGLHGATLTHHLDGMEARGLLTRRRDPDNRRNHLVELTPAGDATFLHLRQTAMAFDRRLRRNLSKDDAAQLRELLDRLAHNAVLDG